MCKSGNPSTTSNTVTNANQSSTGTGSTVQTSSSTLGPTPETLALYRDFLAQAQGVANTPFDIRTITEYAPWTDALDQAVNYQWGLGQQGMGFVPEAAGMIGQGGQSTIGQIPGVAASLLSPWAGQAVDYGRSQGQALGDWATSQAQNIMSQGPQLTPFSEEAVMQYYSPYNQNVIQTTQDWFNNQNAIQGNALLGQGIRTGNAFGGDRAGVAQGVLAGQQQLAQAPVIAGLYNQGYAQALAEFNQQNQLAAQLQQFGASLGLQGLQGQGQLGLGGLGMGLNAAGQANAQAIGALGQNQQAALQAGAMFGNLGATQFGQNLAGGQAAIGAGGIYPQYLQGLYNLSAQNEQMLQAYPFQTSSWYGGLLGGLGPLTGSQQAALSNLLSQQQINQIGTQIANNTTTPPQQNQWIQAAGLGLAGLGLFLKDGGSVPRLARGGNGTSYFPYGEKNPPYGRRGYVPGESSVRLGRLVAPTLPQQIKEQNFNNLLRNLFSGSGSSGGSSGRSSGSGSTDTFSGLTSLLSSPTAKKAAGSLSSLITGSGSSSTGSGSNDEAAEVLRRGGLVNHYQDGGWDDEEPPYEPEGFSRPDEESDAIEMGGVAEEPPSWLGPQAVAGLGGEGGFGGEAVPMPRARPAEAGAGFDEGEQPSGGRWLQPIPGMGQRRRPGMGDLLTNIGLGLMARPGYGSNLDLSGVAARMANFRQQRLQDEALDRKHTVDNSGETQRVRFADGRIWDTGMPTARALQLAQRKEERREDLDLRREALDLRRQALEGRGLSAPKTPTQAALRKFLEENPEATSEQIAEFNNKLKKSGARIPSPEQKDLKAAGTNMDQLGDLTTRFKDDYGGFVVPWAGELTNVAALKGLLGKEREDAAEWWQAYYRYRTDIRHSKFGASLTRTERADWERLDVNPNMSARSIKDNIATQKRIVRGAALRHANSLIAQGFSKEAIEAQLGVSLDELNTGTPAPLEGQGTGGIARPQSKQEYDALKSGTRYIGRDGRERIKQ